MYNASAMQEVNGRQQAAEPFTGFVLGNLDRYQVREVFPGKKGIRILFMNKRADFS